MTTSVDRGRPSDAAGGRPAGPANLRGVARGSFYTLAGSVVTAFATFGFTAIVTRALPDHADAGTLFALTSAFVLVAVVTRMGASTGLVYFLSQYRATGRHDRLLLVWRAAYIPVVVLATAVGAAGVVAAPALTELLVGRDDAATVTLTRVLALLLVFSSLNDLATSTTRGYGTMRPFVLIGKIARPVLQIALAIAAVVAGIEDVLTLGLAWVVPFVPASLLLLWWARKLHRADVPRATLRRQHGARGVVGRKSERGTSSPGRERRAAVATSPAPSVERRTFWRFALPRMVGSIAQMAIQRIDIVLLGVLAGPASAALYTAATRFLAFGQLGGQSINLAIQPKVAALLAVQDTAGARQVYRAATSWLMLLTWPIYLTFVVHGADLLAIFGPGYDAGANVIVILSVTMLAATSTGAVDTMLVMAGKPSWTMANATAALVVNIALNLLLIPRYGITGAAIAWAAAIAVNNLVPLTQLALAMRLHPFGRQTGPAAVLPVVSFLVLPWLVGVVIGDGPFQGLGTRVTGTIIGALIYAGCLWRWRGTLELAAFVAIRRGRRPPSARRR
jgi:O-antigen/teichoic acid export membrane protein